MTFNARAMRASESPPSHPVVWPRRTQVRRVRMTMTSMIREIIRAAPGSSSVTSTIRKGTMPSSHPAPSSRRMWMRPGKAETMPRRA